MLPPRPLPPQTIRVVAKPGGWSQFVSMFVALVVLAIVFAVGTGFGVFMMFAGGSVDENVYPTLYRDGEPGRRIAVIPVESIIDGYAANAVRDAVTHVLNDSSYRAVVLRVDSPGGEVTASDQIWYEVERLHKAGTPVIASYGSMATSGGYYISCSADQIMAEPTSVTGSIGVIAQVLTLEGLMDKVGVEPITLVATSSPEKGMANDIFRSWTDEDRAALMTMLDAAYHTFRERVSKGRGRTITTVEQLDAVASGAIFTADQALLSGLVDRVGYLDDAIAEAEKKAGLPAGAAAVVRLDAPLTLFGGLWAEGPVRGRSDDVLDADRIRSFVNDLASPRVMYLMR